MSNEVLLTIDGNEVKACEGMTLFEAARNAGINIPTLCHHDKLEPYGVCRICTVEIESRGRKSLVAACIYPVENNLVVNTRSEKVVRIRKMLLELMLAYAPESKALQQLAQEYGISQTRFEKEPSFCILCGLCVRYCMEVEKKNALMFIGSGDKREVAFVPQIASQECQSCKRCFALCPTQALQANFVLTQALISRRDPDST